MKTLMMITMMTNLMILKIKRIKSIMFQIMRTIILKENLLVQFNIVFL